MLSSESPLRSVVNEYGTPVSVFICATCGDSFTVCPAVPLGKEGEWRNCLAETCPSYDVTRDIDLFWEAMNDNDLIGREQP